MEKILVTGGNGYLGSCICHELSKTKSVHKLQDRLEEIKPRSQDYDMVIHCAGALRCRKGQHQKANAEGTRQLINGLKAKTKFVYISSKSIYGLDPKGTLTEQTPPQPTDDYGITKYEGEQAVLESGFPFIIIRPSTLFGLGLNNLGLAFPSIAMQQLYQGNDIDLYTHDVLHEYLYVWDLTSIVSRLVGNPANWNNIFNVPGPKRSLHQLINTIVNYLENNATTIGKVNKIRKDPFKSFYLDSTKLEKAIGNINYTQDMDIVDKMGNFINSDYSSVEA